MTKAIARPRRIDQPEQGEDALEETRSAAGAMAGSNPASADSPAPVSRPHPHALWLEAGGGTDAYDADRYVGLLRDHGYALERKGLVAIVEFALYRMVIEHAMPIDQSEWAADLARVLVDELGKQGYRIHDVARCVRPAGDPLAIGRPMTPEEEASSSGSVAASLPSMRDGHE